MIVFSIKISDVGGWFVSYFMLYFKSEFCNVSASINIKEAWKVSSVPIVHLDISSNDRSQGQDTTG